MNVKTAISDSTAGRYNIYANIHKALRAFMGEAPVAVGRLDADDDTEVAAVAEQLRVLHTILASHTYHAVLCAHYTDTEIHSDATAQEPRH
jgi:hypothetical protein